MSDPLHLDFAECHRLALRSAAVEGPCSCRNNPLTGWESMPLSLPETQLRDLGCLGVPGEDEPSYEEYLPDGIRYWSANAPIAVRHFPYNRCNVWECVLCGRCYLRYTEGGGYFVDKRIRLLDPALMVDAPL